MSNNHRRTAVITGADGQDSSYLIELLLEKGYSVHGLIRRNVNPPANILHLQDKIELHYGDLASDSFGYLLKDIQPTEVYHLGAQSDVRISFDTPLSTVEITGIGTVRILEAIRYFSPKSKMYFAGSTEMFGSTPPPQNESTPMIPCSPYSTAKLLGYHMSRIYRSSYGLFTCNGILANHESERRGFNFVTRKITYAVARIYHGLQYKLEMGNIEAKRDWGYSRDYVEAMWLMLQQDQPDDYVIGTGEAHSIKEFLDLAFSHVGLDWQDYVVINPKFYRPTEVNFIQVDANKARKLLGWQPKTTFKELVDLMVDHDMALVARQSNGVKV